MTNSDFIKEYIRGTREYNAYCHLGYRRDTLWNYSTIICRVDRENKTAQFNCKKYSSTTSRIQSELRYQLSNAGNTITDYVGADCNYWNYGIVGAENWTVEDFRTKY